MIGWYKIQDRVPSGRIFDRVYSKEFITAFLKSVSSIAEKRVLCVDMGGRETRGIWGTDVLYELFVVVCMCGG